MPFMNPSNSFYGFFLLILFNSQVALNMLPPPFLSYCFRLRAARRDPLCIMTHALCAIRNMTTRVMDFQWCSLRREGNCFLNILLFSKYFNLTSTHHLFTLNQIHFTHLGYVGGLISKLVAISLSETIRDGIISYRRQKNIFQALR
jgi:hypothetical protein